MTVAERNRLVEQHVPVAYRCFHRFMEQIPPRFAVDGDGIRGAAMEGLVDAASRWDPGAASDFSTFVWFRMWGAMQDELRGCDWLPRSRRRRVRQVTWATDVAAMRLQHEPSRGEIAAEAGLTVDQVDEALLDHTHAATVSLDLPAVTGGDTREHAGTIGDYLADRHDGYQQIVDRDAFRQAWEQLTDRERYVLTETAVHGRDGCDVACDLGVSESRVSQIGTAAALKLRRLHSQGPQPGCVRRVAA